MNIYPLDQCPLAAVDALIAASSLFREVNQIDPSQFELLLKNSQILEFRRGEVVIEPGQIDSWFYCLLHGQLAVYTGELYPSDKTRRRVNRIVDGELFGDFAVLMDHARSALIIADTQYVQSTVVRTDFSIFGELDDMSRVTLPVKLAFYRSVVQNLHSKLERYREQFPHFPFAQGHRYLAPFSGEFDSFAELLSLDAQAKRLAELLISWNRAFLLDSRQE